MSKKHSLILTIVFCVFIGTVALISLFLPNSLFSETENRNLAVLPKPSISGIADGSFMTGAENYISDHIAFRDGWVEIKAFIEKFSGKSENNGVYFAEGGALINRISEPDSQKLSENITYINSLSESIDIPVYFSLIPTAAEIYRDKLPDNAPSADEEAIIDRLYNQSNAQNIDLLNTLSEHRDDYIYYRTDHHWTSLGAFYASETILQSLGESSPKIEDLAPKCVTNNFFGTTYSSSCAFWTKPDSIYTYIPQNGIKVQSTINGSEANGSLYVEEKLSGKDKYAYFLGGNQPLCVIKSSVAECDTKLLIIRDSYADSLVPFLCGGFSEIHLIDLRYNRADIGDYISENNIDAVLVLYGFGGFAEDNNLFLLAD